MGSEANVAAYQFHSPSLLPQPVLIYNVGVVMMHLKDVVYRPPVYQTINSSRAQGASLAAMRVFCQERQTEV